MRRILRAGTIKRIHVDRRIMAQNAKRPKSEWEPAWIVQTSEGSFKAVRVEIIGTLVGDQRMPALSCGARMYLQTRDEVIVQQ